MEFVKVFLPMEEWSKLHTKLCQKVYKVSGVWGPPVFLGGVGVWGLKCHINHLLEIYLF